MAIKILVTGAAGFIGSHLCERMIDMGHSVVGVDNFSDFYARETKIQNLAIRLSDEPAFQLVEADIRDQRVIQDVIASHRPKAIIHLAAMAGVRPSIESPSLYTDVNVNGTVHLLDAAVANGVEKIVFASSSSVYGNNKKVPFAEEDPVDFPISPYAATKRAGELLCHSYWHLHQLPIACLRFFTVYGPRQRPDLAIAKFFRLIEQDSTIELYGDGTTSRDYTYISDIIDGICAAFNRIDRFRIYNLGGNHPVTLTELIASIESTMQRKAKIVKKPMQPGDVNHTFADLTRCSDELDYQSKTSLQEGLKHQWRWYQNHQTLR